MQGGELGDRGTGQPGQPGTRSGQPEGTGPARLDGDGHGGPATAALERMDWRLIDAAKDLGASEWGAFRQITLRLTAPGLVTGTLLVFIPMMGEYVIPLVLGGGRVDFIGNTIQRLFLEAQDYALGSALALLVMGALSFFVAIYLYLSTRTEQEYGA